MNSLMTFPHLHFIPGKPNWKEQGREHMCLRQFPQRIQEMRQREELALPAACHPPAPQFTSWLQTVSLGTCSSDCQSRPAWRWPRSAGCTAGGPTSCSKGHSCLRMRVVSQPAPEFTGKPPCPWLTPRQSAESGFSAPGSGKGKRACCRKGKGCVPGIPSQTLTPGGSVKPSQSPSVLALGMYFSFF